MIGSVTAVGATPLAPHRSDSGQDSLNTFRPVRNTVVELGNDIGVGHGRASAGSDDATHGTGGVEKRTVMPEKGNNGVQSRDATSRRIGDATAAGIIQAAAQLLARYKQPTVGAVAQAAGLARGTVYRYFPTRQALLAAVVERALLQAEHQMAQANLAAVPVEEGLARAVRALVVLGDDFLVLFRQRLLTGQDIPAFSLVVALLERGRKQGGLRSDLPLSCQIESLFAIVHACLRAGYLDATGPEDISAVVLRLFLEGSKPPPAGPPR